MGSGELVRTLPGPTYSAQFTPDGASLFTTGVGDYAVLWDLTLDGRSPQEIDRWVSERSPWRLRDGRLVLAGGTGG